MKLLISWSGEKSKTVAIALRDWIPDIMERVEPWMSETDIDAGARWSREISDELEETKFGIICLTKSNLNAPWILFEAGALAKTIDDTYVCPYLIDMDPSEIPQGPLTQFQAKRANEKESFELISTINKALKEKAKIEERLRKAFDAWWPDLKKKLEHLPKERDDKKLSRPIEAMLQEVLDLVRGLSRRPIEIDLSNAFKEFLYENIGEKWTNVSVGDNLYWDNYISKLDKVLDKYGKRRESDRKDSGKPIDLE